MANLVIVTKHCYLLCESINYISVEEAEEEKANNSLFVLPKKKKLKRKLTRQQQLMEALETKARVYEITIDFVPVAHPASNGGSRRDDRSAVTIMVRGYTECLALFKDMVHQIREQMPDQLYLDKLVEKFFTENPDPKS
jgi:hypothetical protein